MGAWDVLCIRYAYAEPAPGQTEDALLRAVVSEAVDRHVFLSGADARPASAAEARGSLWDDGDDAVTALESALRVRRIALDRFGEANVASGRPLAELEEVLAPLYFHHRYQLEAAVKRVGGLEYQHAVRGDGRVPGRMLDAGEQRRALAAVLAVLDPAELDLPESVLRWLAPPAFGSGRSRESFHSGTGPAFDGLGAAASAADHVVQLLLDPARLARLEDFHRREREMPGVTETLDLLLDTAFRRERGEAQRLRAVRETVQRTVADRLMAVAARPDLRPSLRARLEWSLRELTGRLNGRDSPHESALAEDLRRFLERGAAPAPPPAAPAGMPPGSPIGTQPFAGCASGR